MLYNTAEHNFWAICFTLTFSLTKGVDMYLCVSQFVCVSETEKMIGITESKGLRKMKK